MHHGTSGHKLTYECNIRNWLTQISGILFEQNLYYNTGNGSQCYNGNIGSMTWKSGEDGIRGYKFTYDNMSRMKMLFMAKEQVSLLLQEKLLRECDRL